MSDGTEAWRDDANCRDMDPALFFPDTHGPQSVYAARMICGGCRVRIECLEYALSRPEPHGVWGGMTENQRQHERRRRMSEPQIAREARRRVG